MQYFLPFPSLYNSHDDRMDSDDNNRNGDYQAIGSKGFKVVCHRLQSGQFCNRIVPEAASPFTDRNAKGMQYAINSKTLMIQVFFIGTRSCVLLRVLSVKIQNFFLCAFYPHGGGGSAPVLF